VVLSSLDTPAPHTDVGVAALRTSNPTVICAAARETIRVLEMREVFSLFYLRIPIFQRRYCWGQPQWKTLLQDVLAGSGHVLGRLTAYESKSMKGDRHEIVVCDGQQRAMTCLLLLAAVRDLLVDESTGLELAKRIDEILCPNLAEMQVLLLDRHGLSLVNGEFTLGAISPTYLDRASFYEAVFPKPLRASFERVHCLGNRPMEAKLYLLSKLREFFLVPQTTPDSILQRCSTLVESVLSCRWLYFPLRDGTEDLSVIFERLARHDRGARPRPVEGVDIDESDLVRSLLLGSFRCEADALEMYQKRWLCIERAAQSAAHAATQALEVTFYLNTILQEFIDVQVSASASSSEHAPACLDVACENKLGHHRKKAKHELTSQGVYLHFCKLLESDLGRSVPSGGGSCPVDAIMVEQCARNVLGELVSFVDARRKG
jgi:hypothetical protein